MWDSQRVADPDWFLDRDEERQALRSHVEERRNVLVYGHRRLGKSSLIRRVAADLKHHAFLIVNCQFADSEEKLGRLIISEIRGTRLGKAKQFLDWARHAAKGLEIGIEVTAEHVMPVLRTGLPGARPIEETLEFVTRVAKASKNPIIIVLDEFQTVMASAATVAKVREHAQSQNSVSYIVAGSQPSVLLNLTRHKNPFWRQLQEFLVGPIDVAAALRDVSRLTKLTIPDEVRTELASITHGNTQRLAEILETCYARHHSFAVGSIKQAVSVVLSRHAPEFERILGQRTAYQRQVLVALALDEPKHPTGSSFIKKHDLRGSAFVHKAMLALQQTEILAEEGQFVDPLFAYWLRAGTEHVA